eukprot:c39907_g1_i1 orf=19-219(-)
MGFSCIYFHNIVFSSNYISFFVPPWASFLLILFVKRIEWWKYHLEILRLGMIDGIVKNVLKPDMLQ